MEKHRLLAVTDGVIAILITIMVLELKAPEGAGLDALAHDWPVFLSYVLSFVYLAIYWNNHHHYFHLVRRIDGAVLWGNLHLMFWLSLVPFATAWMGEHAFAPVPTAVYGLSLLMPAFAWKLMQRAVFRADGGVSGSALSQVLGRDLKANVISPALYVAGIALSFVWVPGALACYAAVALMWLVPDRRMERAA